MAITRKYAGVLFFLLLIVGANVGICLAAEEDPFDDALADFYTEHNQRGLETVKLILEEDPENESALALQALFEIRLGHNMNARWRIREALKLDPENAFANIANSWNISNSRDDPEAEMAAIEKALAADPELAIGYNERGTRALWDDDYESALADYSRAIELEPNYLAAQSNLGLTYLYLENTEAALEAYNRAIEINPESPAGYLGRGYYFYLLSEYEPAIIDYTKAIELSEDDSNGYLLRGDANLMFGDYEACLVDYSTAIDLGGGSANVFASRAWANSELGNFESAIADYESAIELDPEFHYAYNGAAYLIAYTDGDLEIAMSYVNQALEIVPDDMDTMDTQAYILYKTGKLDEALEIFSELILNGYTAGHYGRGLVYEAQGEVDKAISDYTVFLDEYPEYEPLSSDAIKRLAELEG
ncbi:MAG: tetratricopeptide repeat protein [Anaerolineales bacterium]|nr:tetratricopeptide repeat protein [Chloroflexota bacterium]MBL6981914.1 tetratricopeptide repeat protein [Anaerolineales bacterium]